MCIEKHQILEISKLELQILELMVEDNQILKLPRNSIIQMVL